jgi:ABC-type uncharacterized transport system permease subunit
MRHRPPTGHQDRLQPARHATMASMTTSDRLRRLAGHLRLAVVLLGIGLLLAGSGLVGVAAQAMAGRNCDGSWFNYIPNSGLLYSPMCGPSAWSYVTGGVFLVLATAALLLPSYALSNALVGIAAAVDDRTGEEPAADV